MSIAPKNVHETLKKYMLVDGFDLVCDLRKSQGCWVYDQRNDKKFLDCFSFFATVPVGFNHPKMNNPKFIKRIGEVALNKPSNSDTYTREMAEFVETFGDKAMPDYFKYLFFISGGALAVENAIKTAFDWKVRKNLDRGKREKGSKVIHFKDAFHGRTGYTLSMTNTFDPNKTRYFSTFDWPRVTNPKLSFPLNDENLNHVKEMEKKAVSEIEQAVQENPDDIAALIIEPIQGEGGDNHFRREFFYKLRSLCDEHEMMFILDEVQSGMGITGRMWAHQNYDFKPDIVAFGKKTQVCGIMVGERVDEVRDNVFRVSSRLNSTWGGNLVDMVRCQKYLEIIDEENLVNNADIQGKYLQKRLKELSEKHPDKISNVRGEGLMCAFDLNSTTKRDRLKNELYRNGLIILGCGSKSIRFRPPLIVDSEVIDLAIKIIDKSLNKI
ncbi:MAG: L-lysine 6-transaminase [Candidatus Thermoplasmatota archaeon]